MKLSNKVYDIAKWFVLIVLPALATLYGVLAECWTLPYSDNIVITINAVACFLGSVMQVSSKNYNKQLSA